jgi:hypothetical protein
MPFALSRRREWGTGKARVSVENSYEDTINGRIRRPEILRGNIEPLLWF